MARGFLSLSALSLESLEVSLHKAVSSATAGLSKIIFSGSAAVRDLPSLSTETRSLSRQSQSLVGVVLSPLVRVDLS
jgi:hypothetical protein